MMWSAVRFGIGVQGEVEPDPAAPRREAQSGDGGDLVVGARALEEQGRLADRGPGAPHHGRHEEAALVEKDQAGPQRAGFFLMRGHSVRSQRRMAGSSRSRARRSGFWGLQPRARNRRPT